MQYIIIQPPFSENLVDMPKKELRKYYQWYMDIMPERIKILTEAVQATPGFELWEPDYTPESLNRLGEWFVGQVETRKRTPVEIQGYEADQKFPIEIPNNELTTRTFSLGLDIGMYLGQVMIINCPALKWMQPLGGKRFVDYGQPSLAGFGRVTLNPVRIAVGMAYGVAANTATSMRLRSVYDIWSQLVEPTA